MSVTSEFVLPFFEGAESPTSPEVDAGLWPIGIDGVAFMCEPRDSGRRFIEIQRLTTDNSTEPGEQTLSPESNWRRSASDWSLGAGQTWFDETESESRRYRTSRGIDPWGDRIIRLLPDTQEKRNSGNAVLKMITVQGYVYFMDGNNIGFGNVLTTANWGAFTSATGLPGGTHLDICSDGSTVYVLASTGDIWSAPINTAAFTLFLAGSFTRVWFALGRLIASTGFELFEITAAPAAVSIFAHRFISFVWTDVVGSPAGLYVCGNLGDNGEVYHTVVMEDGSVFEVPVQVLELIGTKVNALATAGPLVFVATDAGIQTATLNEFGNRKLEPGGIIPVGDVKCLTVDSIAEETFVWFGYTNPDSEVTGLGRLRPSRFTAPNVPAWAPDVFSPSQGIVTSVVSAQGKRFFAISQDGFQGPHDSGRVVAQGTISTGRIRYGLLDSKIFLDVNWRTDPLIGSVLGLGTFDEGSEVELAAQVSQGSTQPNGARSLGAQRAEWVELEFTLARVSSTDTVGPSMRWWVMRAVPAPEVLQEIKVMVNLHKDVMLPGSSRIVQQDPRAKREHLATLVRERRVVRYQEGRGSETVQVTNMETENEQWLPHEAIFGGRALVTMRTVV